MPIEWTNSSGKHGISQADAFYAIVHAIGREDFQGRSGERVRVYVGHPHAQTDRLIEVIVALRPPQTMVVFHVMPLSDLYRHLAGE